MELRIFIESLPYGKQLRHRGHYKTGLVRDHEGPLAKLDTPPCGQEGKMDKSKLEIKHCSVAQGAVYAGYSEGLPYRRKPPGSTPTNQDLIMFVRPKTHNHEK